MVMETPRLQPLAMLQVAGVPCVVVRQNASKAVVVYLESGEPVVNDIFWRHDPWLGHSWQLACRGGVFARSLARFDPFVDRLLQYCNIESHIPEAEKATDGGSTCRCTVVIASSNLPASSPFLGLVAIPKPATDTCSLNDSLAHDPHATDAANSDSWPHESWARFPGPPSRACAHRIDSDHGRATA